jgi:ferric-dicitrate binding protein FerR (iron transport regulator)
MWLFIRRSTDLDEKEREELATIRQASETAETLYQLVQQFLQMVRKLEGERLDARAYCCSTKPDRGAATFRQWLGARQSCCSYGVDAFPLQCANRRAGDQNQTHQTNDVWPRRISLVASARFASFLAADEVKQASFARMESF